MAVHVVQHGISHMLQRNIHVTTDFRIGGHLVQHVLRETGRIGIMDADPFDPFHLRQALQQFRQRPTAIQVQTVIRRILGDQHQFPHAFAGE